MATLKKLTEIDANDAGTKTLELTVGPRYRDLVGFQINRVWPTARRRLIGPFIFYDRRIHTSGSRR